MGINIAISQFIWNTPASYALFRIAGVLNVVIGCHFLVKGNFVFIISTLTTWTGCSSYRERYGNMNSYSRCLQLQMAIHFFTLYFFLTNIIMTYFWKLPGYRWLCIPWIDIEDLFVYFVFQIAYAMQHGSACFTITFLVSLSIEISYINSRSSNWQYTRRNISITLCPCVATSKRITSHTIML